ncbi:sugar ABC transporter [Trinickia dabaoshanensis]|uniref:sugar ABC transporter n=1 Tax=Trinickia dabaoshanensis TaxID=564714 RepID=UPI0038CD228C
MTCIGLALGGGRPAAAQTPAKAVRHINLALYDGADPPLDLLQAFDALILDPAAAFDPTEHPLAHTVYIARTSATEGESVEAFVAQQVQPLWQRGYRGVLLDTPAGYEAIDAIHAAHPDAAIVVAGGGALEVARRHAAAVYAVLAQGLFSEHRDSLAAAQSFEREFGIPVVALETCEDGDRVCEHRTADQALAAGLDAYVTDPAHDLVGIGRIEVMPRKILVVQDLASGQQLDTSPGVTAVATPLNYLGYDVRYARLDAPLPADVTPDRYAGVVAWLARDNGGHAWRAWVQRVIDAHVPIAFFGQLGFAPGGDGGALGLQPVPGNLHAPLKIVARDAMVGFETMPVPDPRDLPQLRIAGDGRSLLGIDAGGQRVDAVGIMPWGGFALNQYNIVSLDSIEQQRWAIQPISFLQAALRLPALPAPNVTTENGRRLLMSHVDGDGFASRAEFPGPDYSGQALYDRIWTRYPIPTTLSVIEGEVGADGLYPQISPRLEQIARQMFALPYVEIGTHTYSHPFTWENVDAKTGGHADRGGSDAAFSLNIPGYKFDLDREIAGSIAYIDRRLAPAGKHVVVLQWSGDCMPPALAVRRVYETGVYNFNGGDTTITKADDSWLNIAPIGVEKGPGAYQVYAPNQDENVYTNDWQGPFYGFTQVLQTYAMTDRPLRFKPIDIYYHMYSGTKMASLRALDEIFRAVLEQPVLPVHVSDYIRRVLDWRTFAVARDANGWLVRGNGAVRELHWSGSQVPRLDDASGVTGYSSGPDGTYIHIDGGSARFEMAPADTRNALPYIDEANGFVRHFQRLDHGLRFEFGGYYKPFFSIANGARCRASSAGLALTAERKGTALRVQIPAVAGQQVTYRSIEVDCGG